MIIYRPHRGGILEALSLAKEFNSEEEMKEYIYNDHKRYFDVLGFSKAPFEVDDIVIDKSIPHDDFRCGWHDTMHVCVKRYGEDDYMKMYGSPQCIGMCATDYDTSASKLLLCKHRTSSEFYDDELGCTCEDVCELKADKDGLFFESSIITIDECENCNNFDRYALQY